MDARQSPNPDDNEELERTEYENEEPQGDGNSKEQSSGVIDQNLTEVSNEPEGNYITGTRLYLVVVSLILAAFLMTLGSSVVATVWNSIRPSISRVLMSPRLYHGSLATFIQFQISDGMEVCIF